LLELRNSIESLVFSYLLIVYYLGKVAKTLKETSETEGMGESEEEIGLEIATTSETKGTKQEEKEFIEEDPSRSFFSDEKSSLPSTQDAKESALPLTEGVIDTSFPMAQGIIFSTSNFVG
jgi:hypothetical protein